MKKLEELGIFPGPWECRGLRSDWILGPINSCSDNNIIVRSERLGYRCKEPDEYHYANMRLISAAPELYDALIKAYEFIEQIGDAMEGLPKDVVNNQKEARKALAKAAGEELNHG